MSLEIGGRADKGGNTYENRYLAGLLIDLIQEHLSSIEVEPLGDEGKGVEFIATAPDGRRKYYQCKAANGAQDHWRPCDMGKFEIFQTARDHILSGEEHTYHFISPLPYHELDSLCDRARENAGLSDFLENQLTNENLRRWWKAIRSSCGDDGRLAYDLLVL